MVENRSKLIYPKYEWERLQQCLRKVVSQQELIELRKTDWYRHLFKSTFPITEEEIMTRPWIAWENDDDSLPF